MEGPANGIALLSATLEKFEQATAKQMARESLVPPGDSPQNADETETEIQMFYATLSTCGFSDDHSRRIADYATQHGRPTAGLF